MVRGNNMKKILLGSTAMIAAGTMLGGQANAQIELGLGGYMQQWFGYASQDSVPGTGTNAGDSGDYDGFNSASDTEVHFIGSTTLDNGLKFGVNIQLEGNTSGDQIDESYLFVDGSFGRVEMGSENSAQYKMQYAAPDVGIGLNSGDQTNWVSYSGVGGTNGSFRTGFGSTFVEVAGANDARGLTYYTPRFAGFQVGATYRPNTNEDANGPVDRDATNVTDIGSFGINYVQSFGGFDVAVAGGYGFGSGNGNNDDPSAWSAGLNVGFAGFTLGGSYAQTKDNPGLGDTTGWDAGVSYGTGPWAVSLAWFHGERSDAGATFNEAKTNTYHLSSSYALGPGIKVAGTLGYMKIDDEGGPIDGEDNKAWYIVAGPNLSF